MSEFDKYPQEPAGQTPPEYGQTPPGNPYQQTYQPPPGYGYPPPGFGPQYYNEPVGFIEAYKNYWRHAFNFNDRTTRAGYWWAVLMTWIISTVIGVITGVVISITVANASMIYDPSVDYLSYPYAMFGAFSGIIIISAIWNIANFIPSLSIMVRRLHDTGKSWPWLLLFLIPYAGFVIWIIFMVTDTKFPPDNQFGLLRQV